MKDFIIQYWATFAFGLLITGGGLWYKRIIKRACDQRIVQRGTQALLRNQIIHNYEKYTDKEWMPLYARENIVEMYESYHALGGNGAITDLVEELRGLPSSPPDKGRGEG